MQRAGSVIGLEENETTAGIALVVTLFLETLDVEDFESAGDMEFNKIQEFLRMILSPDSLWPLTSGPLCRVDLNLSHSVRSLFRLPCLTRRPSPIRPGKWLFSERGEIQVKPGQSRAA